MNHIFTSVEAYEAAPLDQVAAELLRIAFADKLDDAAPPSGRRALPSAWLPVLR